MEFIEDLVNILENEVKESALELIRHVVSIHRQCSSAIKIPQMMQEYRFALAAANRLPYSSLSEKSRNEINYLRQIKI
jgi:hypothetical protein